MIIPKYMLDRFGNIMVILIEILKYKVLVCFVRFTYD